MSTIAIYGASDQGRCTADLIERAGRERIAGFLDDHLAPGTTVAGHRVLGGAADLPALQGDRGIDAVVVAIGDNGARSAVAARLRDLVPNLAFATVIDPTAVVARDATIGAGTVIMAGAVVGTGATVGGHALLCVQSSLDHDASLGDGASLAPAATTGGWVTIGAHSAVGLGASIIHGITVGAHTVIGAGSTVVADVTDHVVAYGTPCRVIRPRHAGERYL